jgi:hemerythrin-like domain-containing protein
MQNDRDPIGALQREHEAGLQRLTRLENAAEAIRTTGFSAEAFEEIADVIRWFNTDVRRHTEQEEHCLFPMMELHVAGLPEVLRSEHRELRSASGLLLQTVNEVEEGRIRGSSIQEVVQISKLIVELMRNHIAKENNLLFPLAKEVLTPVEYGQLCDCLQQHAKGASHDAHQ